MKTVCIDCRYLGPRPSGIGELVQALVDHVPAIAPDLHFLLLRNPERAQPLSNASNVTEIDVAHPANGPVTMWLLSRAVDLSSVDLFHATFNIMPAGLRMPCLVTIHDIMWLTSPQLCEQGLLHSVRRAFFAHGIGRALDRAHSLATVSDATRRSIEQLRPDCADRLHVTRSGVSQRFRPVPTDPRVLAELGLPRGRRFVLTVGQYAPYKNHEGALRAFALACADRPDLDLVLLQRRGGGKSGLERLARKLGIAHRIHRPHSPGPDGLVSLYAAADLLLHPSFCEGFGNPLAEAMACGCPVVTSDLSAMPEVTNGAALLAPPDDPAAIARAIGTVLDDAELAGNLRRKGLERATELDWGAFAAENVRLYRRALA